MTDAEAIRRQNLRDEAADIARCYGGGTDDVTLQSLHAEIAGLVSVVSELRKELAGVRQMLELPGELATAGQRRVLAKHKMPLRVTVEQAATIIAGINSNGKRKT